MAAPMEDVSVGKEDVDMCEIEATVATGFEQIAKEELEEKLKVTARAARGKVIANIPVTDVKNVMELGCVDNIRVVMTSWKNMQFPVDELECMNQLRQLVKDVNWDAGLRVWKEVYTFKHPIPHTPISDNVQLGEPFLFSKERLPKKQPKEKKSKFGKKDKRKEQKKNERKEEIKNERKEEIKNKDINDVINGKNNEKNKEVEDKTNRKRNEKKENRRGNKTKNNSNHGGEKLQYISNKGKYSQHPLAMGDFGASYVDGQFDDADSGSDSQKSDKSAKDAEVSPVKHPEQIAEVDAELPSTDSMETKAVRAESIEDAPTEEVTYLTLVEQTQTLEVEEQPVNVKDEVEDVGSSVDPTPASPEKHSIEVSSQDNVVSQSPQKSSSDLSPEKETQECEDLPKPSTDHQGPQKNSPSPITQKESMECKNLQNPPTDAQNSQKSTEEAGSPEKAASDSGSPSKKAKLVPHNPLVPAFRVTCNRAGEGHKFDSQGAAANFGGAVQEYFGWNVDMKNFDIEVILNIEWNDVSACIGLTKGSLHHRNIAVFGATTLRPTIAYNMLRMCKIEPGDIVCDPMCGSGSIPIQAARGWPQAYHLAGEKFIKAVDRTAENVAKLNTHLAENEKKEIAVDSTYWDVNYLPFKESSVDVFITDLPFGKRMGSKYTNQKLYPGSLLEMARACRPGTGRVCLLTMDKRTIIQAIHSMSCYWQRRMSLSVNLGGLAAGVYLLYRTHLPVVKRGPVDQADTPRESANRDFRANMPRDPRDPRGFTVVRHVLNSSKPIEPSKTEEPSKPDKPSETPISSCSQSPMCIPDIVICPAPDIVEIEETMPVPGNTSKDVCAEIVAEILDKSTNVTKDISGTPAEGVVEALADLSKDV